MVHVEHETVFPLVTS